jgi:hypothetical protein
MAEVFKPIGSETSVNTTATTVSTSSKLIRLVHTGAAATVSNTITCKTLATFNSNTSVDSTNDFITLTDHRFNLGDIVVYTTSAGNTALTGLANNTAYYVGPIANSSGIQLASSLGGANLNITKSVSEVGHNLNRTNYTITLIGGQSVVLEKYTGYDTLTGTDGGTNVKAVAVAYTN